MRLPRWLIEAPYLYPLSVVVVLYAGSIGVSWLHRDSLVTGAVARAFPLPLVAAWVVALGIGGAFVLAARPLHRLRLEAAGLACQVTGFALFTIADAVRGSIIGTLLLAALTFGTVVQLHITSRALRAGQVVRRIHERDR